MAGNKKTTEPCFSNGTEMMVWQDTNCCQCLKYTTYNEKLGRYPQFRCAVQRDIELQAVGYDKVSQRSYDACRQSVCPFIKRKDGNVETKTIGKHVAPPTEPKMPLFEQKPINIQEEAERTIRQREAEVEAQAQAEREKTAQEERAKHLDNALAKAYDRRMNRHAVMTPAMISTRQKTLTPQLMESFKAKGVTMKQQLDDIIRLHLSSYHIIIHCSIDIGDSIMQDCIREIKSRGLFKQSVKRQINIALDAYRKIQSKLESVTAEVSSLRNIVLDEITDEVKMDVFKLTNAMKSVLDKNNIPDSMLIAKIDTAWAMFEMARQQANVIHDAAKSQVSAVFRREKIEIPRGFFEELEAFFSGKRPDAVTKEWQKVSRLIHPIIREVADQMSDDVHVKNAIAIIHKKIGNVEKIDKLSQRIIKENPAVIDEFKRNHPDTWDRTIEIAV